MNKTEAALNRMLILTRDHSAGLEQFLARQLEGFFKAYEEEAERASYRLPYEASVGELVREAGLREGWERAFLEGLARWLELEHDFTDREALSTLVFSTLAHDYALAFSGRPARHYFRPRPGPP